MTKSIPSNIMILYVDDEESNLFIFEKMFERNYRVLTALSGSEGLAKLEGHSNEIIVVISDMRMPLMNGVEFIKKAKSIYANIAYFILTGFDFNDEIEEALNTQLIHKFFTKPFEMQEIELAIAEAIKDL
ncbi:MAG: response regulator [Cyclobacteriaceae bacterium]|nr:response regulator [Cyclobacteriaceae bacterium]